MKPYIFATMPDMQITGLQQKIKYHDASAAQEIGMLWQKFESMIDQVQHVAQPMRMIGLYTDYNPHDGLCTIIVGLQVTQYDSTITPEFVNRKIPSQRYAVFSGEGVPAQIVPELWQKIWHTKELQRAYTSDFEMYEKSNVVDIYVAIK